MKALLDGLVTPGEHPPLMPGERLPAHLCELRRWNGERWESLLLTPCDITALCMQVRARRLYSSRWIPSLWRHKLAPGSAPAPLR